LFFFFFCRLAWNRFSSRLAGAFAGRGSCRKGQGLRGGLSVRGKKLPGRVKDLGPCRRPRFLCGGFRNSQACGPNPVEVGSPGVSMGRGGDPSGPQDASGRVCFRIQRRTASGPLIDSGLPWWVSPTSIVKGGPAWSQRVQVLTRFFVFTGRRSFMDMYDLFEDRLASNGG